MTDHRRGIVQPEKPGRLPSVPAPTPPPRKSRVRRVTARVVSRRRAEFIFIDEPPLLET